MSNNQWHQDQAIGEAAQRAHDKERERARACACDKLTEKWDYRDRAALCDHLPECPQHFSKRNQGV